MSVDSWAVLVRRAAYQSRPFYNAGTLWEIAAGNAVKINYSRRRTLKTCSSGSHHCDVLTRDFAALFIPLSLETQMRKKTSTKKALSLVGLLTTMMLSVAPTTYAARDTLRVNGGDDRVVVANAPALNPSGAITLEAWVRPTTNAGCQTIVGKNFVTGFWLGLCEGKVRYYTNGIATSVDGIATVPVGSWTHVAVTFDGNTRNYYVNGLIDRSVTTPGALPVTLNNIGIGGEATDTCGDTCPFLGDISEVRLWSIARELDDIRRDIAKQLDTPRSGLVAVWSFDGGPDDVFGVRNGTLDGNANFDGLRSPPVGEAPLQIPRILTPTLDGLCEGVYGPLRIPVWNEGLSPPKLEWLFLGATATDLYVCMEGMPRGGSFVGVYVDPTNDATEYANPDDFRLRLQEGGALFSEAGSGSGGYFGPGPTGATAAQFLGSEFEWRAEFRIPRSLLEMGPDNKFRLQVIDDQDNGNSISGDWGWPVGYFWDWPALYEEVVIDDTILPLADDTNPSASAFHLPSGDPPAGTIEIGGHGFDLSYVASITVFLDFVPVETCNYPASGTFNQRCRINQTLSPGRHHVHSVVTDHAGRTTTSQVDSFRVIVDGNDPQLSITSAPILPPIGGTATVTATATDPAGITFIEIGTQRCDFSGTNTQETCIRPVTDTLNRRVITVSVRAADNEGSIANRTRRVIFGDTGTDSDGDGLPDAVEDVLCTDPNNIDTDGDSLLDRWEVLGVMFEDGDYTNLPDLGANPCRKDVFLQYDYEQGARLANGTIEQVVAAYRRNGVTLHVEENERPRPTGDAVSTFESAAAGARVDSEGEYYFPPKHNWTHYYAYSRHSVGVSSAGYRFFTYDIYVGSSDCECPLSGIDPATCGLSGEAIDTSCVRESVDAQARRFMHELGHMMGLGHGGRLVASATPSRIGDYVYYDGDWDNTNHKPNYRSVMNYLYDGGDACITPDGDYVRNPDYSDGSLGVLFETGLDERPNSLLATNLAADPCELAVPGSVPVLRYSCADPDESATLDVDLGARRTVMMTNGVQNITRFMHGATWAASGWNTNTPDGIDFNCDGQIGASVSGNVNGNQGRGVLPLPSATEICGDGIDTNGDGVSDARDCWWQVADTANPLIGRADWGSLPRPAACILPYSESRECYPQPAAYRSEMAADMLDCRPAGDPVADCAVPVGGRQASRGGTTSQEAVELDYLPPVPGSEACDGHDNDADLIIDEGCRDTDNDGISDAIDNCPTVANTSQSDVDADGLGDACDALALGPLVISVQGDIALDISWDALPGALGYNVYKSTDGGEFSYQSSAAAYPSTGSAFWLDVPPLPGQLLNWRYRVYPVDANGVEGTPAEGAFSSDDDLDGVANVSDNCLLIANPTQLDSDGDSIGNACDPDIAPATNDCVVNVLDLAALRLAFFGSPGTANWNPDADFNGDGVVNVQDLAVLKLFFFSAPGPGAVGSGCGGN